MLKQFESRRNQEFLPLERAKILSVRNILKFLGINKSRNLKPRRDLKDYQSNRHLQTGKVPFPRSQELALESDVLTPRGLSLHVALFCPQSCLANWVRGITSFDGLKSVLKTSMEGRLGGSVG